MTLFSKLSDEIKAWALIRAILLLLPFWILSGITANPIWMKGAFLNFWARLTRIKAS